ncbi:hypothetical protein I2483_13845 [Sporosarcina sp. E16_3]|uniref:hypothetical protein n=1 Tax=Sporosarcina sp. E16_3 TaxID=2789293 RepID=UPI001A933337|nr:hypothetical protein [Sporosarcina sp. E16_3]MBO0602746.1 hypothetical protein [Sporosarcina sp. E16_3]
MDDKYLVLNREAIIKALTEAEIDTVDLLIEKIIEVEGFQTYTVSECKNAMGREYLVTFEDVDSIVVSVKEDINRPNNPDCEEVLREFIEDNYGYKKYDYIEISTCERFNV